MPAHPDRAGVRLRARLAGSGRTCLDALPVACGGSLPDRASRSETHDGRNETDGLDEAVKLLPMSEIFLQNLADTSGELLPCLQKALTLKTL